MSTFSQWNGPGDVPGDFTILYQRILELERLMGKWEKDLGALVEGFEGDKSQWLTQADMDTWRDDTTKILQDMIDAFNTTSQFLNHIAASGSDFELDTGLILNGLLQCAKGLYIPDTLSIGEVWKNVMAAKTWIFCAKRTIMNHLSLFDGITFQSVEMPVDTVTDGETPETKYGQMNTDASTNATDVIGTYMSTARMPFKNITATGSKMANPTRQDLAAPFDWSGSSYILGVFDAGMDGHSNGDSCAATFYATVNDTYNFSCVLHASVTREGNGQDWHGGIDATYTFSGNGNEISGAQFDFDIIKSTTAGGANIFLVVAKPWWGAGSEGNSWFIGRNVRHWDDTKDQTGGHSLCHVRTEHGEHVEGGACHGNIMNGVHTNDLSAYVIKVFGDNYNLHNGQLEVFGDIEDSKFTALGTANQTGATEPEHMMNGTTTNTSLNVLRVYGKIKTDSIEILTPSDLTVNNLTVNGTSLQKGAVTMNNTLSVAGKVTASQDVDVGGKLAVTGNATVGGNQTVSGNQTVNGNASISGTLNAGNSTLGNISTAGTITQTDTTKAATLGPVTATSLHSNGALEAPNATVLNMPRADATFKNLNVTGNLGVDGNFKTDRIVGRDDTTWLERRGGTTTVGATAENTKINSDARVVVTKANGSTEDVAYLSDLVSGTLFQKGVTWTGTGAPNLTQITLETGLVYHFESGDTYLQQGNLNGTTPGDPSTTVYWQFDGTSWAQQTPNVENPPKNGNHWMTFMWFGFAQQPDGTWGNSYIFWNPNNAPAWSIADLHMEGYRLAIKQDHLDGTLGAIATIQPDWLATDPVMQTPSPVPSEVPSTIPNPAYIQNKPWLGVTILNGGNISDINYPSGQATTLAWDCVVEGGDLTQVNEDLSNSVPSTGPTQFEVIKNALMCITHCDSLADLALVPPSPTNPYQLVWVNAEKKLVISDGSQYIDIVTGTAV